ncbi:MAG TPA: MarR family transcriptional regulator [Tepidisphaeraceae bacterium]|jgi:DNA-binding MarR family transcriptional regulator|nr:MarR family transcriptional regulator [Tepidisphaeraceae bacterium]
MQSDIVPGNSSEIRPEDESRSVLDSIRRIVQLLRRSSNLSEKKLGLSSAQLFVLHKLVDVRTLSVGELAERTLTSQSSVSEVVQKLVTAGLVARTRSTRDARSVELSLTDAGRKIIEKAPVAPQDYLLAALNRLPTRDRRQLAKLLARLVKETGMVNIPAIMLFEDESAAAESTGDVAGEQAAEPEK